MDLSPATYPKITEPHGSGFQHRWAVRQALHRHLKNGNLVLTYGYRKPLHGPISIRAKISGNLGKSWGEEIILRTGGGDEDIGYTRNVIRQDGKMVTVYYWQEDEKKERYIASIIWDPSEISNQTN